MYLCLRNSSNCQLRQCSPSSGQEQPLVLVCILARNAAPTLPYFLGQLEELDYPKDKLRIYIRTDHNSDNTEEILQHWIDHVQNIYESIDFKSDPTPVSYPGKNGPFDWPNGRHRKIMELKEEVLEKARNSEVEYILFLDTDVFLTNDQVLRRLIAHQQVVVAPMLETSLHEFSSFWTNLAGNKTEEYLTIFHRKSLGCFAVPVIHMVFLINLKVESSQALTFIPEKLPNYDGKFFNDKLVLAHSAAAANIRLHILNTEFFGYALVFQPPEPRTRLEALNDAMNNYVLHLMYLNRKDDIMPLLHSPFVKPSFPEIDNLGLDQIYFINLDRRPDRAINFNIWLRALGLSGLRWSAYDGRELTNAHLIHKGISILPNYLDPFTKTPMTTGEIGCFLSHMAIWEDVIQKGYKKVAVFEDDAIFKLNFRSQVKAVMSDIDMTSLYWDMIYLSRRPFLNRENSRLVNGQRFLANVSYSYWMIGYLLNQNGARKLIQAKPLNNLLPLDEYLPIMYDQHPNEQWKSYFPIRNMVVFTMKPLVVEPHHFAKDPEYVSDTFYSRTVKSLRNSESKSPKDEL